jgi:manganese oxidase
MSKSSSGHHVRPRRVLLERALVVRSLWIPLVLTLGMVASQQWLHRGLAERGEPGAVGHLLRDGALAWPAIQLVVLVALSSVVRDLVRSVLSGWHARAAWALLVSLAVGAVAVPGTLLHGRLFVEPLEAAEHHHDIGGPEHLVAEFGSVGLVILAVCVLIVARTDPWSAPVRPLSPVRAGRRAAVAVAAGALALGGVVLPAQAASPVEAAAPPAGCAPDLSNVTHTLTADVVALDQAFDYNRLGATNPAGMIFALRNDVVLDAAVDGVPEGTPITAKAAVGLSGTQLAGNVTLRPEKRPRPLTLRMAVGDCLEIHFQNLLGVEKADPEQPGDRRVGVHVKGLAMVNDITDDGTGVGKNPVGGLVGPGEEKTYSLFAEHEGGYVLDNGAARAAGEAVGGTTPFGLFGAVNVEPWGTNAYRSQLTRVEMDLAASAWNADGTGVSEGNLPQYDESGSPAVRLTPDGQPILNYDAVYPTEATAFGYDPARAGMPIVRMVDDAGRTVHSDLNAVIAGPRSNDWKIPKDSYPEEYWANEVVQENQRRGEEPFREFTVIFHDDIFAVQAFPELFDDPATFEHTLHGVRDGFGVNYGVGGVGAEVIANRLKNAEGGVGVGPMADCVDCKYEEFFLTAWAVGDPAMVVDHPANQVLAGDAPAATLVKFPDDPSNVHHSYLNDRVKFRNLHAGPKEHHIFHLHAHQWQQSPNEKKSSYLDSQLIGPGDAHSYDIAYGGSGNRNKTVGDSIFHCHFYPHFAQGMWELWRTHDTFERGTVMDAAGRPAEGSRALPDGEITAGTPIPAIVPLPSRPMAPVPYDKATVVKTLLPGASQESSQVDVNGDGTADVAQGWLAGMDNAALENPGYPFFIAGVAGHRPPTPPLDIANGEDGGLPRHVIIGGTATSFVTPRDFNKILDTAQITYVPEAGTPAERAAMAFHEEAWHPTYASDGTPVNEDKTRQTGGVGRTVKGFETNGLPRAQGAPFADPCRSDGTGGAGPDPAAIGTRDGAPKVRYKAAVIQLDATFNKVGWHFPQQRIEALWEDAAPTISGTRPPEPLVMRIAAGDCAELWHTNLVPNVYELDDYQVRTPTDVIGQHIHLVKFDVTSADGSANGFNYEDGTLSPQEVEERIHAVRAGTKAGGQPMLGAIEAETPLDEVEAAACPSVGNGDARLQAGENGDAPTPQCPLARLHPFFGDKAAVGDLAWGARTTVQRWYADPVLNDSWDRGHGSVFTHDHFGPSTHQQTGLYATVLIEPEKSTWRDPETGAEMTGRHDGGPTSWRADILTQEAKTSHREFYLELGDFEHAYLEGGGKLTEVCNNPSADGSCADGVMIPSYADPAAVVNPSHRVPAVSTPDLFKIPADCPNGTPRPCPEAISADDIGTMLVNYRNEPLAHRVFDPVTRAQAKGPAGDLAYAFQSRTDRAMPQLNTQPDVYPTQPGVKPGDPFTPMLRAYAGDLIRVRFQVGATEEQHNVAVQGLKWKEEPLSPESGWRSARPGGISEYFIAQAPVLPNTGRGSPTEVDATYMSGAATEDLWNGSWGLLRAYQKPRSDLVTLPGNEIPSKGWAIDNLADFNTRANAGTCPTTAPVKKFVVYAVRASALTGPDGLVYNDRGAELVGVDATGHAIGTLQARGKLVDPTALVYVLADDLDVDKKTGTIKGLKSGVTLRPLTLRVNAGDCASVELRNALPATLPELPGYDALPPILAKATAPDGSQVTFNANDLRTSTDVGLHTSLAYFDPRSSNGMDVGNSDGQTVPSGQKKAYMWYAGDLSVTDVNATTKHLVARPVEFGAIGLSPADPIKQSSKGLVGALVVEPPGATWTEDPGDRTKATVTMAGGGGYRELVALLQDNVNLRYSGDCPGVPVDMKCAVPSVASEGKGVPEDAEDSGQKAVNYQSDPVWYRLGIAPDVPFELLRDNTDTALALHNSQVGGADPSVPILTAKAGDQVRIMVVQPAGHARGHVLTVDGHSWMRQPTVPGTAAGSDESDRLAWWFPDDPTSQDKAAPGHLPNSDWTASQEGIGPAIQHNVLLPRAGGPFEVEGDYLVSDAASFGSYQGLWALLRVQP